MLGARREYQFEKLRVKKAAELEPDLMHNPNALKSRAEMESTARLVGHLDSTDECMVADSASHRDELRQQRTANTATTLTPMNVYGGLGCPVVGSMGSPFGQAAPTHNPRVVFGDQKWICRIAMRVEPSLAARACDRFGIPGVDTIDDLVVEDREHGIQVFLSRVTDLHVWCGLP